MIVCGLDQAPLGTGYCTGDGSAVPAFGYKSFPEYGENEAALMIHVRDWLTNLAKSTGAEACFTEQIVIYPNRIHMPSLHKQFAIVSAVAFVCGDLGIDHYQADLHDWRKWFIGCSVAPRKSKNDPGVSDGSRWLKEQAIYECAQRGFLTDNEHVAEAIGIWSFGLAQLDRTYRHRTEVFQRRAVAHNEEQRRERAAA